MRARSPTAEAPVLRAGQCRFESDRAHQSLKETGARRAALTAVKQPLIECNNSSIIG